MSLIPVKNSQYAGGFGCNYFESTKDHGGSCVRISWILNAGWTSERNSVLDLRDKNEM